jgi:phosphoserine phosphatase
MNGSVKFQDALRERLNIIQPTSSMIQQLLDSRESISYSDNLQTLITTRLKDVHVYIISGGFEEIILPFAEDLGIPAERVFANKMLFDHQGTFIGIENRPTARSGGKLEVIKEIKAKYPSSVIVHIGDGATDLETLPVVDLFIGYGGNVSRDLVKQQASWFITDFASLL